MSILVETRNLKKYFNTSEGKLHAVDGVNLSIEKGHTMGVVGESGCGKSTLGRVILNLLPITSGDVFFEGSNIAGWDKRQMHDLRKEMQIIFQDPYSSLDPRMTVHEIISEPMCVYKLARGADMHEKTLKLMETVGLSRKTANSYPHELDGGRRQRIGVARALALDPKFIVCDEPVSALDVSIQAQILNLLMDLQRDRSLTYLFITHDLSVVKHISDEIAVMYLGQCVERAPSRELFKSPVHPYTCALLGAILEPDLSTRLEDKSIIRGEVTSPINPSPGCRFALRCDHCESSCTTSDIPLKEVSEGHFVACNLAERL